MEFDPPLSEAKCASISRMGFGLLNKVSLCLSGSIFSKTMLQEVSLRPKVVFTYPSICSLKFASQMVSLLAQRHTGEAAWSFFIRRGEREGEREGEQERGARERRERDNSSQVLRPAAPIQATCPNSRRKMGGAFGLKASL